MTLIACLHPKNGRVVLADILIWSLDSSGDQMMPSRAAIPPERLRAMRRKPAGLCRKLIEISPNLVIAWAGNAASARDLGRRAKEWFRAQPPTKEEMELFLKAHYYDPTPNLWAIMVSALTPIYFMIGDVIHSTSAFAGEYAVAGSGKDIFVNMVNEMLPRGDEAIRPDHDALRIANDLIAREVVTGETLLNEFGGSYEVVYQGPNGFERVDDLMHIFGTAKLIDGELCLSFYEYGTRQWYEDENLWIVSVPLYAPENGSSGAALVPFCIPGILGQHTTSSARTISSCLRPRYFCVHTLLNIHGLTVPTSLVMQAEGIDKFFRFEVQDLTLTLYAKQAYLDTIRRQLSEPANAWTERTT